VGQKECKAIPNAAIARKLLQMGNTICDIKPLNYYVDKGKKPSNFIFVITEKFAEDYKLVTGYNVYGDEDGEA